MSPARTIPRAAADAPPRRDSRRERKKARTRREIFSAAMALIGPRGFEAVTVEQVCAAADVAKGTFFLHFPSKAALLLEWERQLAKELVEALRDDRGSSLSQVRILVERLGDHWLRRPDAARALLRELLASADPRAAEAQGGADLRGVVGEIVRRGQERGELRRNVSAPLAAEVFLAACAAVFSRAPYGGDDGAPERVRNELLHALLHGLHEPKPRVAWRPA